MLPVTSVCETKSVFRIIYIKRVLGWGRHYSGLNSNSFSGHRFIFYFLTGHQFHDFLLSSRVSVFDDDTGQWNFTSTLIFHRNNTNWLHSWVEVNHILYLRRRHLKHKRTLRAETPKPATPTCILGVCMACNEPPMQCMCSHHSIGNVLRHPPDFLLTSACCLVPKM